MNRCQLPWMANLKLGDVIRSASGTLRVVRKLSRYKDGELRSVYLTIRRCSWTRRPYTVLSYTDLRIQGFTKVGASYSMRTELDKRLAACIADHNHHDVTCCEVKSIA